MLKEQLVTDGSSVTLPWCQIWCQFKSFNCNELVPGQILSSGTFPRFGLAEVLNFVALHALWAKIADVPVVIGRARCAQINQELKYGVLAAPVIRTVARTELPSMRADTICAHLLKLKQFMDTTMLERSRTQDKSPLCRFLSSFCCLHFAKVITVGAFVVFMLPAEDFLL